MCVCASEHVLGSTVEGGSAMYTGVHNTYTTSTQCGKTAFVRNTHVQDEQAPENMHK